MATNGDITITIHGLDDLREQLRSSKADKPVARFLNRGAIYMQREARMAAPVDTGRLRNSIGTEAPNTRTRSIGPNVEYAEYVEFGTRPHMPPVGALAGWAKRHGLNEEAVARGIAARGTKAQPYMQPAADATEVYIVTIVPILAAEIESAFQ